MARIIGYLIFMSTNTYLNVIESILNKNPFEIHVHYCTCYDVDACCSHATKLSRSDNRSPTVTKQSYFDISKGIFLCVVHLCINNKYISSTYHKVL